MGKILAFANQKGGIGKTTSAINIAAAMAVAGKKVLAVDCDPQGNMTSGFGINKKSLHNTSYDMLVGRVSALDTVQKTAFDNISVIPANISLAGAEFELVELEDRAYRLKNELLKLRDEYDYIVIDCPRNVCRNAMRILRLGGINPAHDDHPQNKGVVQPGSGHYRHSDHHVQRPAESVYAGSEGAEALLCGQASFGTHPQKRAHQRSSQLRNAHLLLRQVLQRNSRL